MKIIPSHERILLKRVGEGEKTKGGIVVPDTAKEKQMQAKVIAVGKGEVNKEGKLILSEVKEGDRVLLSRYAGANIKIEGGEHLIVRENDILGIVEE
jgi:chaperonin GroES